MKGKKLEEMTFDELVNFCAEVILKELMQGNFRQGVWHAADLVTRWSLDRPGRDLLQEQEAPHG